MEFQDFQQSLVAIASLAEAIGCVVKQPFEDRVEQSAQGFLRNSVTDGGDAQRAELAGFLRKKFPTEWKRAEGAILQIPFQSLQVLGQVGLKHFEADLIDARCAPVAFDRFEGRLQQGQGNPPGEGVCFWCGDRE